VIINTRILLYVYILLGYCRHNKIYLRHVLIITVLEYIKFFFFENDSDTIIFIIVVVVPVWTICTQKQWNISSTKFRAP